MVERGKGKTDNELKVEIEMGASDGRRNKIQKYLKGRNNVERRG